MAATTPTLAREMERRGLLGPAPEVGEDGSMMERSLVYPCLFESEGANVTGFVYSLQAGSLQPRS